MTSRPQNLVVLPDESFTDICNVICRHMDEDDLQQVTETPTLLGLLAQFGTAKKVKHCTVMLVPQSHEEEFLNLVMKGSCDG